MDSDPQSASFYPPGFDFDGSSYTNSNKASNVDYTKQQGLAAFDFYSFQSPADVLAPHPDLFESELDSSLAAFDEKVQLQLLTVDSHDAFSFFRSETPTQGPPSTITVSSESAYETLSSRSESFYNYPNSPSNYAPSNYSFPLDLDMEFQRIRVDSVGDYGAQQSAPPNMGLSAVPEDQHCFGALPPTQSTGSVSAAVGPGGYERSHYERRASLSDYESSSCVGSAAPRISSSSSEYYPQYKYASSRAQSTVSPANVSPHMPVIPSVPLIPPINGRAVKEEQSMDDPRKKYPCTTCNRAFARAYNLKTHMATHDPNRPKPHVCPHRSCGRSFSRKHDLGRHLVSIHRDESACPPQSRKSFGVEKGPRGWCESCGRGWVGKGRGCDCDDVK